MTHLRPRTFASSLAALALLPASLAAQGQGPAGGHGGTDALGTLDGETTFSTDCNENGIPDQLELAMAMGQDAQNNGILDECETDLDPGADCNRNDVEDLLDIQTGFSLDCDCDGKPDECEMPPPAGCNPPGVVMGQFGFVGNGLVYGNDMMPFTEAYLCGRGSTSHSLDDLRVRLLLSEARPTGPVFVVGANVTTDPFAGLHVLERWLLVQGPLEIYPTIPLGGGVWELAAPARQSTPGFVLPGDTVVYRFVVPVGGRGELFFTNGYEVTYTR